MTTLKATRRWLFGRTVPAAGALLTATGVVACGSQGSPNESAVTSQVQGAMTAWTFPLTPDDATTIWKPLMEKFKSEQPKVEATVEVFPWGGRLEKMLAAVAGGEPPEIAYLNLDFIAKFADIGALVPQDTFLSDATKKSYHPEVLNKVTYKGKMAISPILMSLYVPFYNVEMVERAGLNPNKLPVTWKELEEWAAKLHRPEQEQAAISHNWSTETSTGHMYNWIWQAGGELIKEPDGKKALFNSREGVEALEFVLRLFERRYIPEECKVGKGPGLTNAAILLFGSNSTPVSLAKNTPDLRFKVGHILQGKKRQNYGTLAGYGLFKGSKGEAAAKEWLKFMQRPENMGHLLRVSGYMPPVQTLKAAELYPGDVHRQHMVEESKYVHLDPLHPQSREMSKLLAEHSQKALLKQVQPKQALDDAAQQLELAIARGG